MRKLIPITMFAFCFMVTEIVGGTLSGSLAILCDAAHQLSDVLGFVISIVAVHLAQQPRTDGKTFGKARYEVVGAIATVLIIWVLVGVLIYEAIRRIIHIDEIQIDGGIMLITSVIGILFNVVNLTILNCCCNGSKEEREEGAKEEKENVNVRAAIIHLLGDLIQAIGVFVAAMLIYFRPEWKIADPITTFVFAVLVSMTTIPIFLDSMKILMELTPDNLDMT